MVRQVRWGALDQAIFSLSNFALAVVVAGSVSAEGFGAFGVVYIAYTLTVGISDSLTAEVFTVVYSAAPPDEAQRPLRAAAGCAIAIGLIIAAAALALGVIGTGPVFDVLPAFGAVAPALMLQSCWRYALFALGRPRAVVVNDAMWLVVQAALVGLILASDEMSVSRFVLAWGGGAIAAACFGAVQLRVIPHPLEGWAWLTGHWQLGWRFAAEFVGLSGSGQVVLAIVGALGGLAALASVRAALLLYGPIQAALNGARVAVTPLAVRALESGTGQLHALTRRITVALSLAAAIVSAVIILMPGGVGTSLLGASWAGARDLLAPLAVWHVAVAAGFGALIGLRALRAANRSLRARSATAALTLVLGTAGTILAGDAGAVFGMMLAAVVGLVLLVREYVAALSSRLASDRPEVAAPYNLGADNRVPGEQDVPDQAASADADAVEGLEPRPLPRD